jgi:hypothetical protein
MNMPSESSTLVEIVPSELTKEGGFYMDPLAFYVTQSHITDPSEYVGLFVDLPDTIDGLCRVVQGLCINYFEGAKYGIEISKDRLQEVDTRYVNKILARIIELDDRPLTEPRAPENRFVGCCRDAATLLCAMARHQGIPTRTRVGFATYFIESGPGFNDSHEIAEYWEPGEERWRLVDPELDDLTIRKNNIQFDTYDITRDQFIVAGKAWQLCHGGEADPNRFGFSGFLDMKGLWFIRANLLLDLAAQNKTELLLWDIWGLMTKKIEMQTDEEWKLLDKVASLTQAGNDAFYEMQVIYKDEISLKVPEVISCYSFVRKPCEVRLRV